MQEVGNFYLAISLEGFEGVNDLRRGEGVYGKVMKAMDLEFLLWISKMMESLLADVLQEEEIIFILMPMVMLNHVCLYIIQIQTSGKNPYWKY